MREWGARQTAPSPPAKGDLPSPATAPRPSAASGV